MLTMFDPTVTTLTHEPAAQTPIRNLISRRVVCIRDGIGIERVSELFLRLALEAAPVIDRTGAVVGIVTTADLLRELREDGGPDHLGMVKAAAGENPEDPLAPGYHVEAVPLATAGDVMGPVPCTIAPDAPWQHAATLMEQTHSRFVLVLSGGRAMGLVTALDVMSWVAKWCVEQGGIVHAQPNPGPG